jgi:hypothetical protein
MSIPRKIHFNALPESVRRRWVEITAGREQPEPLYVEPLPFHISRMVRLAFCGLLINISSRMVCLAFCGLLISLGLCWQHFGLLGTVQSPAWILGYAGGGFMLVYMILELMRSIALRRALPFAPGRYLFALDLVEAHGEVLELWPMAGCRRVSTRHRSPDGLYTSALIEFHFAGARKKTLTIDGMNRAASILQYLEASERAVSAAVTRLEQGQGRENDLPMLIALDPFFEVRMSDQWASLPRTAPSDPRGDALAKPLPRYLAYVVPIALVASVVLGPATWYARNLLSDQAMFDHARSTPGSQSLQQYLDLGGWRVAEARVLLWQRELDEAQGSAAALRAFLAKYSDHEDAGKAVHALYPKAMAAFIEQASTTDPRLVPFMKALVDHLEKTASAEVVVSFSRPDAALLDELDERVARAVDCGTRVEPVAPHFSGATATWRERAIVDRLQQGFGAMFPQGILSLIHAESSREEASEGSRPSIHVAYAIAPSGSLYGNASRFRAFLGMRIDFEVEMRVPGHPDVFSFELEVQPPSELVVEPSYTAFAELPSSSQQPTDLIYRLTVARAFDQLSRNLGSALFRADSEAFRRVEGTSQVAGAGAGTL